MKPSSLRPTGRGLLAIGLVCVLIVGLLLQREHRRRQDLRRSVEQAAMVAEAFNDANYGAQYLRAPVPRTPFHRGLAHDFLAISGQDAVELENSFRAAAQDAVRVGAELWEIANIALTVGDFETATRAARQNLAGDGRGLAVSYVLLGDVLYESGKYLGAKISYWNAIETSKARGAGKWRNPVQRLARLYADEAACEPVRDAMGRELPRERLLAERREQGVDFWKEYIAFLERESREERSRTPVSAWLLADASLHLADVLRDLKRYDEAEARVRVALEIYNGGSEKMRARLPMVREKLAEVIALAGQP